MLDVRIAEIMLGISLGEKFVLHGIDVEWHCILTENGLLVKIDDVYRKDLDRKILNQVLNGELNVNHKD